MQLDDTKDKVYIYDLDEELKTLDEDEEKMVFLPDIERKINRIPKSILRSEYQPSNQEMVLYHVPSSLSVSEEQDSVRKAIIESRARARQERAGEAKFAQEKISTSEPTNSSTHQDHQNVVMDLEDEDVMDLG